MGKVSHRIWALGRTGQAVLRMAVDPERTTEAHVVEELTSVKVMQAYLAEHGKEAALQHLLAGRPELSSEQIDFATLRELPEGTLGRAYSQHLDGNGVTADSQAAPTRYVDDDEISYLIRRFRQTHDIWHVLASLGISVHEEIAIHAFSWGQLGLPISKLTVVLGGLKYVLLERRWHMARHEIWDAYQRGREAQQLLPVTWEDHWAEPLDEVRRRYNVQPCPLQIAQA